MQDANILIIEDDSRIREIVRTYAIKENYQLFEAETGKEAFDLLDERQYQVIVLDVMLPDTDGWTILRKVKEGFDIPVIMLTARAEEEDKLFGFDLGADDYMTKPFSAKELMARIKIILKHHHFVASNDVLEIGGIEVNTLFHQVAIHHKSIEMTPLEYKLLLYFVDNQNLALTRNQILDAVWGFDYFGDERTVDTHVKRLRQKLLDQGELIKTVRGHGYRMVVDE